MKNLQLLHRLRQLREWLLGKRKILFPVLSTLGVLFFILCDYEYYPWLTLFFVCVFMGYIFFGVTHIKKFTIERDADGKLTLYDIDSRELRETEQERLERAKTALEKRLSELNQQNNQPHEQN